MILKIWMGLLGIGLIWIGLRYNALITETDLHVPEKTQQETVVLVNKHHQLLSAKSASSLYPEKQQEEKLVRP